jgi:hypothetical protein
VADDTEPGSGAPTWQFCRDGYDITADVYAEQDADKARVWDGEMCLLAVVRDGGWWHVDTSDLGVPDDAEEWAFRTPTAALDWFTASRNTGAETCDEHADNETEDQPRYRVADRDGSSTVVGGAQLAARMARAHRDQECVAFARLDNDTDGM